MSKEFLTLVIQARMNSTRFPNKIISDLSGAPLIERILQREKKEKNTENTTAVKRDASMDSNKLSLSGLV